MKDSAVRYLVDAGPLVGSLWAADQWHEWSRRSLDAIGCEVYTTESVLAEAAHLLKPYRPALLQLLAALDSGSVRLIGIYPENAFRCAELIKKYPDRMDAGDASLIVLSELHPRAKLLTLDADFKIYRRRDGSLVPFLSPTDSAEEFQLEGGSSAVWRDATKADGGPARTRKSVQRGRARPLKPTQLSGRRLTPCYRPSGPACLR